VKGLRGQALCSLVFSCVTRGLGLILRLVCARMMGMESLGVMEMASGVQQLMLAPLTGGLPSAVSRLTAMEREEKCGNALWAGRRMALRRGLAMAVLCIAAAPLCALAVGDLRILPLLLLFAPALPMVSVSCAMDGASFGRGEAFAPSISECTEQVVRILLTMLFLLLLGGNLTVTGGAAVPVLAGVLGEGAGLLVMVIALRGRARKPEDERALCSRIDRMALPVISSRMGMSLLRGVTGMLLPRLLVLHGIAGQQAAAQIGCLQGMVMPLLFLPGVVTGAFAALGGPQMAARTGGALRKLSRRLVLLSLSAGAGGTAVLFWLAPLIAHRLYRQESVLPLLRFMCVCCIFLSLNHVLTSMLLGLGQNRALFARQMLSGALTLLLTVFFTVHLGIYGTGLATLLGQLSLCLLLVPQVIRALKEAG